MHHRQQFAIHIVHRGRKRPSLRPSHTPLASWISPMNSATLPTRSLGDKLQLLATHRPNALLVLEKVVDGLLASADFL